MGIDNLSRSRKQEVFSILKSHAKSGEDIYGDGVLEILQDGFGFPRSVIVKILLVRMIFMCHPVKYVLIYAPRYRCR